MWIITRALLGVFILFLFEFYFTKKLNSIFVLLFPSYPSKKKKILIFVFLLLLNLYPAILIFNAVYAAITNQSVAFPQNIFADYLLLYPFWVLIILILQVSVIFIFIDIPLTIAGVIKSEFKNKIKKVKAVVFLILIVLFGLYVPARIIYDYNSVDVRHVELKRENLSKELNGFKIAFISDVQADRYTDKKRLTRYVSKINEQNPDLVLIAGDVITSSPDYIKTAGEFIGKIKSNCGTYSCVGDHDNWAYRKDFVRSLNEVKESLIKNNVEMPDNELRYIEFDTSRIGIAFITHNYVNQISETTLRNLSSSNRAEFKIFLTHQPQEFLIKSAIENRYDLFLAGHTHGGQITLLFPFLQLTPTIFETRYIKGDFNFGKTLAIVCGGLGMSLAPVRYNSTPEIVIITLKAD